MKSIHFIHPSFAPQPETPPLLLKVAQNSKAINNILFDALKQSSGFKSDIQTNFLISQSDNNLRLENLDINKKDIWIIISNGRYAAGINQDLVKKIILNSDKDLIMIDVDEKLKSYRENARIKFDNEVAGYRRFFSDSVQPDIFPCDWPHHIFIRLSALKTIIHNDTIPSRFCFFLKRCIYNRLKSQMFKVGGQVFDLETESGILMLINQHLRSKQLFYKGGIQTCPHNTVVSSNARLFGPIALGENVKIEDNALIVGPAIIADNVTIHSSATVYRSIIYSGTSLPENSYARTKISQVKLNNALDNYRVWPFFSYAWLGKRMLDIIISLIILPIFPILFITIAPIIKLTSRGPVFFKHKRQGLHGKTFSCLKFRTMIVDADSIQRKLGFKNQVDGPQFKIDDDPRVTAEGRFLRETHLDEIPQFINILLGQMSLIGPRPSPPNENRFCPYWRDARLSVRPGITGLWQVYRTRKPGQDFQEWIHYDTEYVKNMSLSQDIKIFFKTAIKLLFNFINNL